VRIARAFLNRPVATTSLVAIVVAGGVALAAPLVFHGGGNDISSATLRPPLGAGYVLGTDELGRSVAVQLVFGLRVSLLIGLLAALAATVLGTAVGSIAGYFGGWVDTVLMRCAEVFQVMPTFILAALIVALVGSGVLTITVVIAILAWPESARVVRGEVLRVKQLEFVDAARALGIGEWRIMAGDVIPNALAPAVVIGTLIVGRAILLEAALSFLGLSNPDVVSWGRMLNSGQQYLFQAWWLSVFPGLAVFGTVLTFNLLGDAVSTLLNPRRDAD
jgi:peptide/nickel transport system permease protein